MPTSATWALRIQSTLWGVFCACSWTWCIGMFLPRIMVDRFAWPGFAAFAIPNIVGCAAMGYVVRSAARSRSLVASHGGAMTAFSLVTIAYHMFFTVYLFTELVPVLPETMWTGPLVAAVLFGLGLVWSFLKDRDWLVLGGLVYAFSIVALFAVGASELREIGWRGSDPPYELAWLAPAIALGFLLSPYCDLTFHRAVQQSPSRHAFTVFGCTFGVMLLLTICMWPQTAGRMLAPIALAHILLQSVFTIGAHLREVRVAPAVGTDARRALLLTCPLLGIGVLHAGRLVSGSPTLGEDLYIRFLVFYGLVFPAYVLICMTPAREHEGAEAKAQSNAKRRFLILIATVALCLPLYEIGFVHHRPWLLAIALVLILLATLVSRTIALTDVRPGPSPARP